MKKEVGLLVKKASSGDDDAFMELYRAKYDDIFFLAYKKLGDHYDVEDVAHDVILKIYEKISDLKSIDAFDSWVYTIVKNECNALLRRKQMRREDMGFDTDKVEYEIVERSSDLIPHKKIEEKDFADYIAVILEKMPPERQWCFHLYFDDGLKYKEIAEIMDVSINTVGSHIKRAKEVIKEEMTKNTDYEILFNKLEEEVQKDE